MEFDIELKGDFNLKVNWTKCNITLIYKWIFTLVMDQNKDFEFLQIFLPRLLMADDGYKSKNLSA